LGKGEPLPHFSAILLWALFQLAFRQCFRSISGVSKHVTGGAVMYQSSGMD
jgi:hypothetical protein